VSTGCDNINDLPMLLTPKQTAAVMGLTEAQVRGLVRTGRLAHIMVGKRPMIPRGAIEQFISDNMVTPCRVEIQDHVSSGTEAVNAGTSSGQSEAAAGSAARALRIAQQLKSTLPTSSTPPAAEPARVIPLRSS
jgi:excisionase family DNA binding protein